MLRWSFYALTLLLCTEVRAQLMPFKSYGIKDGLYDNNVQAITRDDRGLLWVGTDFGVYWFDGKRFYQPQVKTNIDQFYVDGFYKGWDGAIWILSFYNGIYKFRNDRFTNYLPDALLKDINKNSVSGMIQIAADKYIVVSDGNPYVFNGQKFSLLDSSNLLLKSKTLYVTRLIDGTILLSAESGIFLYRPENGKYRLADHVLKNSTTSKVIAMGARIWIATTNGLLSFDNQAGQTFTSPVAGYLTGKEIYDITADKNGTLWVLADAVYKIENGKITKYTLGSGLPDNIECMYCDNEGLIWFGNNKGVTMLGDEFYEFTPVVNGKKDNAVAAINTDRQNNLWIGTGNALAIKNDSGYRFFNTVGKDKIGPVSCFYKEKNGELLAATNAGIISVDKNSIKIETGISASVIAEDETGRIFFGDKNGALWTSDREGLKRLNVDHFTPEMITTLFVKNGNVWVGYRTSGVKKYKLIGDSLLSTKEYNTSSGFYDFRARSFATDRKGNVIFGTRTNGLFIFSATSDALVAHITTQNGLSADWIKDILCDTDGKLYLATNKGVNIISGDYEKPVVKQVNINNESINREANCIVKSGNVFYIGAIEGVLKWLPDKMRKDTIAPPIYFTKINIQGRKNFSIVPYSGNTGQISLPYDQNIISFEFAGISLRDPGNIRYQYMLQGQDDDWNPVTEHNNVAYNLKPGDYIFRVIARNADGVASRQPAYFHFIIKPPFWFSWWFIAASTFVVIMIAYGAWRYKLNQVLELELLRNKISTDLHDDIGSTLSSISILSNIALNEPSNTQIKEMIKGISENSTSLLEKMDDIVWSINPKNDTLENLLVRFRRFASVLLEAKNIEYWIEIEPSVKNVKLSMDYRQHIFMILKETINNLVKYAHCTKAYISVKYQNNCLEITVKDNGIGFDQKTVQYGNGIRNMQQRSKQMNAAISINSKPNAGTEIFFRVKIK